MLEPDFSEAQFQFVCNMAICRQLDGRSYPVIPSLNEEALLGWDSGFFLGGAPNPAPDQKGCNFFLQYKLAILIEGPRGKEYSNWGKRYFRFFIPHTRRDSRGDYYKDYHQYNLLKRLGTANYPTFYVSNSVIDTQTLNNNVEVGLSRISVSTNIKDIDSSHLCITYTEDSQEVALHSEPKYVPKQSLENLVSLLRDAPSTTVENDINEIPQILSGDDIHLAKQLTPNPNLSFVENWRQMATSIFRLTGVRAYKWFPPRGQQRPRSLHVKRIR